MFTNNLRRQFFGRQKAHVRVSPKTPRQAIYKTIAYTFFGGVGLVLWTNFYKTKIDVIYKETEFNQLAAAHIPELRKPYVTTAYLPFRLWELTMGARLEKPPYVKTIDSTCPLPDGEQLEIGKTFMLFDAYFLEWTELHVN